MRYVYRLVENKNVRVYEIGERDNPRTHKKEWCDRRVCEGFWGDEDKCKEFVDKMNR